MLRNLSLTRRPPTLEPMIVESGRETQWAAVLELGLNIKEAGCSNARKSGWKLQVRNCRAILHVESRERNWCYAHCWPLYSVRYWSPKARWHRSVYQAARSAGPREWSIQLLSGYTRKLIEGRASNHFVKDVELLARLPISSERAWRSFLPVSLCCGSRVGARRPCPMRYSASPPLRRIGRTLFVTQESYGLYS